MLQMAIFHSLYGRIVFHCMHIPHLLIHSSVDGHLVCFHVLAIVNTAAVNTEVCVQHRGLKFTLLQRPCFCFHSSLWDLLSCPSLSCNLLLLYWSPVDVAKRTFYSVMISLGLLMGLFPWAVTIASVSQLLLLGKKRKVRAVGEQKCPFPEVGYKSGKNLFSLEYRLLLWTMLYVHSR